jgi:hypothetical protein
VCVWGSSSFAQKALRCGLVLLFFWQATFPRFPEMRLGLFSLGLKATHGDVVQISAVGKAKGPMGSFHCLSS